MIFMKIKDVRPVGVPEAKYVLSKREKEKELTYEQKLASEHLKKFSKISYENSKKFLEELSGVLRMSDETKVQILNILPKNADELRMIFAREKFSLKEEEIKKILEIIKKYR
jgi:DNA-directed RNA polymerase subunit F